MNTLIIFLLFGVVMTLFFIGIGEGIKKEYRR